MRWFITSLLIGIAMLLLVVKLANAGQPLPTSANVQRITPTRCPIESIPVVNSQGTSGAPIAVTTAATIIQGNSSRQIYSFISDGDLCAEYGGATSNSAPATTPVGAAPCTAGASYKAGILYWEDVYPTNRMDVACVTGTCHISTVECIP